MNGPRSLFRLRFVDGSRLARTDLCDALAYEARLIDFHERSAHDCSAPQRGYVRPHLATGLASPGDLVWNRTVAGFRAAVDASAAGFSAPPVYLASLAGAPAFGADVIGPFVSIALPNAAAFTVRLLFVATAGVPMDVLQDRIGPLLGGISVAWIGVEVPACTLSLRQAIS